jgi:citronellol/citronellal dehydrogenase
MELSGKVAIVTGASRGLGKIYASALAKAGAAVAVTARTEQVDSARPAAVPTAGEMHPGRAAMVLEGALPGTIHQTVEEITRVGRQAWRSDATSPGRTTSKRWSRGWSSISARSTS